jgi:hypothetical protein
MDTESKLALAHASKKVYTHYMERCKEEIVAFLCSAPSNLYSKHPLERRLGSCESHP